MKERHTFLYERDWEDGIRKLRLCVLLAHAAMVFAFPAHRSVQGQQSVALQLVATEDGPWGRDILEDGGDGRVPLFDLIICPHDSRVLAGAWSIQGLATKNPHWGPEAWSKKPFVKVFELPLLQEKIPEWSGYRFGICFARDGTLIAAYQEGRTLDWWNLDKPSIRTVTMPGDSDYLNLSLVCMTASPVSDVVAIGFHPGVVELWDWNGPTKLKRLVTDSLGWCRLAFHPKGEKLAGLTVGPPVQIKMFQVESGKEVWALDIDSTCESGPRPPIAFSPDGTFLACVLEDQVAFVDTQRGEASLSLPKMEGKRPLGFGFSPVGGMVGVVYNDGTIQVWNWRRQKLLIEQERKPERGDGKRLLACAFTPDGKLLAVMTEEHILLYRVDIGSTRF